MSKIDGKPTGHAETKPAKSGNAWQKVDLKKEQADDLATIRAAMKRLEER